MDSLFTPKKIKHLEIKNRIVFPPIVCFETSEDENFVSEKNINHYETMAKSGNGLIIVEASAVSKNGRLSVDQLGIWDDKFIEGLRKIVEICHENTAKVFIQIHHAGLKTPKAVNEDTISSSDYNDENLSARELTQDEINQIHQDFVDGAIRAQKAGFDGIELHGAHGYLFTQFFSSKVNKRRDDYGGGLDNRLRIVKDVFKDIKKHVNDDFIVGIRMGCNENDLETSIAMAKRFEDMGMDFLHVSTGFDNASINVEPPKDFPCNWIVYGATKIKENVNIPVIAVNGIKKPAQARYLIEHGLVDFIAIGRAQLADPNFVNHTFINVSKEDSIVNCLGCKPCGWFTKANNCPERKPKRRVRYKGTHPRTFEEKYKELNPDKYTKTVARVIEKGGTPAGTHRPILVEEILEFFQIKPGQTGLDATLGYGGHTLEMLKCLDSKGRLYATDIDPIELARTQERLKDLGYGEEILTIKQMNFSKIDEIVLESGPLDFILADLGVSSMQIDNPERGFSFKNTGPLDLRLNPNKGISAAERLQTISQDELEGMLIENADEPHAAPIARAIMDEIKKGTNISTTTQLQQIIQEAVEQLPKSDEDSVKKSCQRCFQALRIDVNDEYEVLYEFLEKLPNALTKGGRVAILSFHSGEDRLVKKSFRHLLRRGIYKEVSPSPIRPSFEESNSNSRARSAKLRWAIKA